MQDNLFPGNITIEQYCCLVIAPSCIEELPSFAMNPEKFVANLENCPS